LDRYKYPKKKFFAFFSSISWGLCTGTKGEKVVLFGFSTGTNTEKLNFYSSNIHNSPFIAVLSLREKKFKKLSFGYLFRFEGLIFKSLKIFEKFVGCKKKL
jgi:hypothetical protein